MLQSVPPVQSVPTRDIATSGLLARSMQRRCLPAEHFVYQRKTLCRRNTLYRRSIGKSSARAQRRSSAPQKINFLLSIIIIIILFIYLLLLLFLYYLLLLLFICIYLVRGKAAFPPPLFFYPKMKTKSNEKALKRQP